MDLQLYGSRSLHPAPIQRGILGAEAAKRIDSLQVLRGRESWESADQAGFNFRGAPFVRARPPASNHSNNFAGGGGLAQNIGADHGGSRVLLHLVVPSE